MGNVYWWKQKLKPIQEKARVYLKKSKSPDPKYCF